MCVMTGSDWVAIAGIAGTLLGVAVGAGSILWIRKREWEREDRYRAHAQRVEAYAEFRRQGVFVLSHYGSGRPLPPGALNEWGTSSAVLALIGSPGVVDAATQLRDLVLALARERDQPGADLSDRIATAQELISVFDRAARRDLLEEGSE